MGERPNVAPPSARVQYIKHNFLVAEPSSVMVLLYKPRRARPSQSRGFRAKPDRHITRLNSVSDSSTENYALVGILSSQEDYLLPSALVIIQMLQQGLRTVLYTVDGSIRY
jgi:hypothetical protein